MFVPIEKMPDHSRTWVYLSDRRLTGGELMEAEEFLADFCSGWKVHSQSLPASYTILENHFVVLVADESGLSVSGCSIDSSVHMLKALQERIKADFFNRNLVPFEMDGQVVLINRRELQQRLAASQWGEDTTTFNMLSGTLKEIRRNWRVPARESWLKTYLCRQTAGS